MSIFFVIGLVVVMVVANFVVPFLLTGVSLPGKFIAFPNWPTSTNKGRIILGETISVIGQLLLCIGSIYLFTHLITLMSFARETTIFIAFIFLFFTLLFPIRTSYRSAKKWAEEMSILLSDDEKLDQFAKDVTERSRAGFNMFAQSLILSTIITVFYFLVIIIPQLAH
jgi:hypothetical protein